MTRRHLTAFTLVIATLLVAGCGGSDEEPGQSQRDAIDEALDRPAQTTSADDEAARAADAEREDQFDKDTGQQGPQPGSLAAAAPACTQNAGMIGGAGDVAYVKVEGVDSAAACEETFTLYGLAVNKTAKQFRAKLFAALDPDGTAYTYGRERGTRTFTSNGRRCRGGYIVAEDPNDPDYPGPVTNVSRWTCKRSADTVTFELTEADEG